MTDLLAFFMPIRYNNLIIEISGCTDLFGQGVKLFSKFAIGILMCLFVYLSFNFAITAAFSDTAGYNVYRYNSETGKEELICQHNENDENPPGCSCAEIPEEQLSKIRITELSKSKQTVSMVLSQIFCFVMMTGILYGSVWEIGNKDISAVKFQRICENKLRGLVIGSVASFGSFAVYVLLLLSSLEILNPKFLNTYRLLNSHFHSILTWIYGTAQTANQLSVVQLILCFALVLYLPLVSAVAYYLGYKDIKLLEKVVFKKKL